MTTVVHPFPPLYDAASRVLILGTMPSPVSRAEAFFYAHPRNRFWPVLAAVFDEPPPASREDRIRFALRRHIALWDVLASCVIEGAADHTIKDPEPNDFSLLLSPPPGGLTGTQRAMKEGTVPLRGNDGSECPAARITRVFTTGQKAFALYTRLCLPQTGLPATPLPSTSPANQQMSFDALVNAYRVIKTATEQVP